MPCFVWGKDGHARRLNSAVEKLLEAPPRGALPEQLAELRFLFEEEFDKLWLKETMSVE